jgi:hypothetical protein
VPATARHAILQQPLTDWLGARGDGHARGHGAAFAITMKARARSPSATAPGACAPVSTVHATRRYCGWRARP